MLLRYRWVCGRRIPSHDLGVHLGRHIRSPSMRMLIVTPRMCTFRRTFGVRVGGDENDDPFLKSRGAGADGVAGVGGGGGRGEASGQTTNKPRSKKTTTKKKSAPKITCPNNGPTKPGPTNPDQTNPGTNKHRYLKKRYRTTPLPNKNGTDNNPRYDAAAVNLSTWRPGSLFVYSCVCFP